MFTEAIDTSSLGTTVGSTTGTKGNNSTDPEASQDRFLKLLVAQINNQDPLNPMDNAQMTSQMAQINTVSGIQELNATLKGMSAAASATQAMQGASLIGRDALIEGNTLSFDGTQGAGGFTLAGPASQVHVDIIGASGEVIDTVSLGAQSAGQHGFTWDAGSLDPASAKSFKLRASDGTDAVEATALQRVKVASVGLAGGAMSLQLQNGRSVAYDQVRGFM
jgi:flagellar basal-body rod modification protein FlgD